MGGIRRIFARSWGSNVQMYRYIDKPHIGKALYLKSTGFGRKSKNKPIGTKKMYNVINLTYLL